MLMPAVTAAHPHKCTFREYNYRRWCVDFDFEKCSVDFLIIECVCMRVCVCVRRQNVNINGMEFSMQLKLVTMHRTYLSHALRSVL